MPFSNSQKGWISGGLRHRIKITTPWPGQGVHDLDQSMFPTSLPTLTSDNSLASKLLAFPQAVCSTRRTPLLSCIFQGSAQVPTPPCNLSRHKVGIHCAGGPLRAHYGDGAGGARAGGGARTGGPAGARLLLVPMDHVVRVQISQALKGPMGHSCNLHLLKGLLVH